MQSWPLAGILYAVVFLGSEVTKPLHENGQWQTYGTRIEKTPTGKHRGSFRILTTDNFLSKNLDLVTVRKIGHSTQTGNSGSAAFEAKPASIKAKTNHSDHDF
jgi:hypothetical protein